jgi:hypothetical protein
VTGCGTGSNGPPTDLSVGLQPADRLVVITFNAGIKFLSAKLPAEIFLPRIVIFEELTARRLFKSFGVKGLTPELNPSTQRCLPRFFTEDCNF